MKDRIIEISKIEFIIFVIIIIAIEIYGVINVIFTFNSPLGYSGILLVVIPIFIFRRILEKTQLKINKNLIFTIIFCYGAGLFLDIVQRLNWNFTYFNISKYVVLVFFIYATFNLYLLLKYILKGTISKNDNENLVQQQE